MPGRYSKSVSIFVSTHEENRVSLSSTTSSDRKQSFIRSLESSPFALKLENDSRQWTRSPANMFTPSRLSLLSVNEQNNGIIGKQKIVGKHTRDSTDYTLLDTTSDSSSTGIKGSRKSAISIQSQKNVRSGNVLNSKHGTIKNVIRVKRAGKGKTKNSKLTEEKVLLTDITSTINTKGKTKNRIMKRGSVRKLAEQKPVSIKKSSSTKKKADKGTLSVVEHVESGKRNQKIPAKFSHSKKKGQKSPSKASAKSKSAKKVDQEQSLVSEINTANFSLVEGSRSKSTKKTNTLGNSDTPKTTDRKVQNKISIPKQDKSRPTRKYSGIPKSSAEKIVTFSSSETLRHRKAAEKVDALNNKGTSVVDLHMKKLGGVKEKSEKSKAQTVRKSKTRSRGAKYVTQKSSSKKTVKKQRQIKSKSKSEIENLQASKTHLKKSSKREPFVSDTLPPVKSVTEKSGLRMNKFLDYSAAGVEEILDFVGLGHLERVQKSLSKGKNSPRRITRPKQGKSIRKQSASPLFLSPTKSVALNKSSQMHQLLSGSSVVIKETQDVTVNKNMNNFERSTSEQGIGRETQLLPKKKQRKTSLVRSGTKRHIENLNTPTAVQKNTLTFPAPRGRKNNSSGKESAVVTIHDLPVTVYKTQQNDDADVSPSKRPRISLTPLLKSVQKSSQTRKQKSRSHFNKRTPNKSRARKEKSSSSESWIHKISNNSLQLEKQNSPSNSAKNTPRQPVAKISKKLTILAPKSVQKTLSHGKQKNMSQSKKDLKKIRLRQQKKSSSLSSSSVKNVSSQSLICMQKRSFETKPSSQELANDSALVTKRISPSPARRGVNKLPITKLEETKTSPNRKKTSSQSGAVKLKKSETSPLQKEQLALEKQKSSSDALKLTYKSVVANARSRSTSDSPSHTIFNSSPQKEKDLLSPTTKRTPKQSNLPLAKEATTSSRKSILSGKQPEQSQLKKNLKKKSVRNQRMSSSLSLPSTKIASSQSFVSICTRSFEAKCLLQEASSQSVVGTKRDSSLPAGKEFIKLSPVIGQKKPKTSLNKKKTASLFVAVKLKKSLSPAKKVAIGWPSSSDKMKLGQLNNAGLIQSKYSKKSGALIEEKFKHSSSNKKSTLILPIKMKKSSPRKFLGKNSLQKPPPIMTIQKSVASKTVENVSGILHKRQHSDAAELSISKRPKLSNSATLKEKLKPAQKGKQKLPPHTVKRTPKQLFTINKKSRKRQTVSSESSSRKISNRSLEAEMLDAPSFAKSIYFAKLSLKPKMLSPKSVPQILPGTKYNKLSQPKKELKSTSSLRLRKSSGQSSPSTKNISNQTIISIQSTSLEALSPAQKTSHKSVLVTQRTTSSPARKKTTKLLRVTRQKKPATSPSLKKGLKLEKQKTHSHVLKQTPKQVVAEQKSSLLEPPSHTFLLPAIGTTRKQSISTFAPKSRKPPPNGILAGQQTKQCHMKKDIRKLGVLKQQKSSSRPSQSTKKLASHPYVHVHTKSSQVTSEPVLDTKKFSSSSARLGIARVSTTLNSPKLSSRKINKRRSSRKIEKLSPSKFIGIKNSHKTYPRVKRRKYVHSVPVIAVENTSERNKNVDNTSSIWKKQTAKLTPEKTFSNKKQPKIKATMRVRKPSLTASKITRKARFARIQKISSVYSEKKDESKQLLDRQHLQVTTSSMSTKKITSKKKKKTSKLTQENILSQKKNLKVSSGKIEARESLPQRFNTPSGIETISLVSQGRKEVKNSLFGRKKRQTITYSTSAQEADSRFACSESAKKAVTRSVPGPGKISSSPRNVRKETYISYTSKDMPSSSLVEKASATSQAWIKKVSYTEKIRNVPASEIATASRSTVAGDHTINTATLVETKPTASSTVLGYTRNYDQDSNNISIKQPSLLDKYHLAMDVRDHTLIRRSYITASSDSLNFSDHDTLERSGVQTEQSEHIEDYGNVEVEEDEEIRDDEKYAQEESSFDDDTTKNNTRHSQQCMIS